MTGLGHGCSNDRDIQEIVVPVSVDVVACTESGPVPSIGTVWVVHTVRGTEVHTARDIDVRHRAAGTNRTSLCSAIPDVLWKSMAMPTLFERIIDRSIPADIIYEDAHCVAFRDIAPQAPVHVLVVPRLPIPNLDAPIESALAGHLLHVASVVALQEGLAGGYRVVVNCGQDGGQTVDHLHLHVLGGRTMSWPPG